MIAPRILAKLWTCRQFAALRGGCPYRRVCCAGCTTMAIAVTGTIYDNPFCVQHAQQRSEST